MSGAKRGSIRKRGNRYQITVDIGMDELTGKRIRHYESFDTVEEARSAIKRILSDRNKAEADPTIADFLSEWFEITKRNLNENTRYTYTRYIQMLGPYFGKTKLTEIKRKQAEIIINRLLDKYKPSTVKVMKRIISTAFNRAIDWELIEKNPFRGIPIKQEEIKYSIWTPEEVQRFLAAARYKCENHNGNWSFYIAFLLALYTGMRKSEILGLRWQNIDSGQRLIFVRESLHQRYGHGEKYVGGTKSRSSRRFIKYSEVVADELALHKKRQIERAGRLLDPPNDYVVTTRNMNTVHQRSLTQSMIRTIQQERLPEIRFHDFRHTHASILLANGVNPKVIQERLGHSKIEITLNTYSHLFPQAQDEAAALLDTLLK